MKTQPIDFGSPLIQQIIGWFAIFSSAFFFYLATVIIRVAKGYVAVDPAFFVFARFLGGFVVVALMMSWQKKKVMPRNYHYLIGRTVTNSIAVFCFFKAVDLGSLAEANILNMTYPLFVAVISWFFLKGQRDLGTMGIVVVAFAGIWLILSPENFHFGMANLWGLCSGLSAAVAMIYLNVSRRFHDSQTILFFMFGLGSLIIFIVFHKAIHVPDSTELLFLSTCAAAGVLGQYLITYGFLFVTAVEGSIISSTRILLAALLGPVLVADPALGVAGWCGALLIFFANIVLALRKS